MEIASLTIFFSFRALSLQNTQLTTQNREKQDNFHKIHLNPAGVPYL